LYRHVLEDPVPGAAPGVAGGAAADPRAVAGGQAARRPAHERPDPGGGPSVLRAQAPRSSRHAGRGGIRAPLLAAPDRAATPDARRSHVDRAPGRLLAPADLAVRDGRPDPAPAGHRARGRLHAGRALLRGRRRPAYTAALVLVGGGRPHRRGNPAPRRDDQGRARPAPGPGTDRARGVASRIANGAWAEKRRDPHGGPERTANR